ncbi:hypothetical protein SESBI_01643 [Sesbania bispinosa]|nr:hypothetical protein SESBI_01643 [Sesbania bispinosa]
MAPHPPKAEELPAVFRKYGLGRKKEMLPRCESHDLGNGGTGGLAVDRGRDGRGGERAGGC